MVENYPENSFLGKISEAVFERFRRMGQVRRYRKSDVIFLESEPADTFYIILKGSVKISRLNRDGKEVFIAALKEGNFFGEMALLDGMDRSADASAEEASSILHVRESDFFMCLEKSPSFTESMLRELARRIRYSDSQIKGLTLLNARGKVASALLRWAIDTGVDKDGSVRIIGAPTQREMASYIGLTRETFNRMIKNLERENYISVKQGGVIVIRNIAEFKSVFGPFF